MSDLKQIFYTADVIVPDGSDTDVYGEPCEPGHGAVLNMGWISPEWSRFEVHEKPEDVAPDVFEPDDETDDPAEWLASQLNLRLGMVEDTTSSPTFYAIDASEQHTTGTSARLAAHAKGFTDEELERAYLIMQRQDYLPR